MQDEGHAPAADGRQCGGRPRQPSPGRRFRSTRQGDLDVHGVALAGAGGDQAGDQHQGVAGPVEQFGHGLDALAAQQLFQQGALLAQLVLEHGAEVALRAAAGAVQAGDQANAADGDRLDVVHVGQVADGADIQVGVGLLFLVGDGGAGKAYFPGVEISDERGDPNLGMIVRLNIPR